jgi:brefeldin A-resistance guanine nucleotide exchange factor 1
VFADRYYSGNPEAVADADSAYVLSYSIIMLNTDQHNPQVKRKMTLEQFVRNNRGTNGGNDWPRETLETIFAGIVNDEIKLTDDAAPTLTPSKWSDMMRSCGGGKGRMLASPTPQEAALYDADLFGIVWSPTIAAVSAVFDHTVDESVLKDALDGFLGIARIAGHHRMTDVMDHLVATLCKFAAPAHLQFGGNGGGGGSNGSGSPRPAVQFGSDDRARTAAVTVFTLANRYGDSLRAGWCNLLDLILRLHKLGLLSKKVTEGLSVDDRDGGTMRAIDGGKASTSATAQPEKIQKKVSSSSSLLRGFSQLLSLESDYYATADVPLTEADKEAEQRATRCIEACRVEEVFADSKFLEAQSLLHMVRALTWAAGPAGAAGAAGAAATENGDGGVISGASGTGSNGNSNSNSNSNGGGVGGVGAAEGGAVSAEDEDTALFCLDILVAVTLRNRDRIHLLLPQVYGYLRTIVQSAQVPTPLVERAIFEVLRIARALLPYKPELGEDLLDSLRLMFALQPAVADAFIERIARELCVLVRAAAGFIKGAKGWDTICKLLMASARHPDAAGHGFEALSLILAESSSEGDEGAARGGGGEGDSSGGDGGGSADGDKTGKSLTPKPYTPYPKPETLNPKP